MRNIFTADIAGKEVVIGQRETLFQLIPQFAGDGGLDAEIPPVLIKRVTSQLRLLVFGLAGDQIGPLAAGGVIHIPVHQFAHPRHFRPRGQRRIEVRWRFIDAEPVLLAKALRGDHRIEAALLHQRAENIFRFVIAPALQQQIGLPVAPFVLLFRFHRQARQPGVQAPAVPKAQRHTNPALHQRGGLRTHDGIVAPDGLLFGHVAAHQAPGDDVPQLLNLIFIELLRLR